MLSTQKFLTKQACLEKTQASLYRISEVVHTVRNVDDLFPIIHDIVKNLISVSSFYIARYDSSDSILHFPYFMSTYSEAEICQTGVTEYILNTGESLLISPQSNLPDRFEKLVGGGIDQSTLSSAAWLGVPLTVHEEIIGALVVQSTIKGTCYGEEEKELLMFIARHIAFAIEREKNKTSLQKVQDELKNRVQEEIAERREAEKALRQNNRNFALLNHMQSLFQTRHTEKNSYGILSNVGKLLFPFDSGCMYIMDNSQSLLRKAASWGKYQFEEKLSDINTYLAFHQAQEHLIENPTTESPGRYLRSVPDDERFLCAPISTSGEMLGVLQLHFDQWDEMASQEEREHLIASKWMLATRIVEHYSLFLVNLRLRERLQKEAIRDPLTGLFNRRHMEVSLEREARRAIRKNSSVGIIMFDLDHFKHFNDTYGHEAGDLVLQKIGETIEKNIRGEDIACRYGGEEFLVILPDACLEDTAKRSRQIRLGIKELRIMYQGQELHITASIGAAAFPEHSATVEAVLNEADKALYQAKARGRDQVVLAPSVNNES